MTALPISRRGALAGVFGLAGAACARQDDAAGAADPAPAVSFEHGVASGDPTQTRLIIWTRVTPEHADVATVPVVWEVAEDEGFTSIFRDGAVETSADRDFTVKVDVDGLSAGTAYFYRFRGGETISPIGRAKTLPEGAVEQFVMGVCSCSNYPAGYFTAYRHLAEQPDVDLILHLGDYFYEYGADGFGAGLTSGRTPEPAHETVTLADYRLRHAQYKRDPDLQAAHARAPWIAIWDDHESANDSWVDGAENHQPETEGDWATRKAAAIRAYFEWMPIREPQGDRDPAAIWRSFEIGDLASLIMLETRLTARDEPLGYEDIPVREGPQGVPVPDVEAFLTRMIPDPTRQMVGDAQLSFIADTVGASVAAGKPWQLLGTQVLMARVGTPNLPAVLTQEQIETVRAAVPGIDAFLQLTAAVTVPWNLDAWNGYAAERERVFAALQAAGANLIALAGDTHNFWANELTNFQADPVGEEFGTSGITSPSIANIFGLTPGEGTDLGQAFVDANPDVHLNDIFNKGYLTLTLSPETAQAELFAVEDVTVPDSAVRSIGLFSTTPGARQLTREA
ncbi:MAG: alkaline phosphatase D family protein [Maricaulaceae bacterium]